MVTWRRRALRDFPDLRLELDKRDFSVYMLFFELLPRVRQAHRRLDDDELRRIYGFAEWCLLHRDLSNAAAVTFYEHLFEGDIPDEEIVPWLSPNAIAECHALWEWRHPEKMKSIDDLIRTRKDYKYRDLRV